VRDGTCWAESGAAEFLELPVAARRRRERTTHAHAGGSSHGTAPALAFHEHGSEVSPIDRASIG
jgi:hypothetical protein